MGVRRIAYGPRVHLGGPKKHPLEYLEHFHWAVESEDSLITEAIKRWGAERILFSRLPASRHTVARKRRGYEESFERLLNRRSGQGDV